jgi:hypothetical protein
MSKAVEGKDYTLSTYDLSPSHITKIEEFIRTYCIYAIYGIKACDGFLCCYFRLKSAIDPVPLLRSIQRHNYPVSCSYPPSECITKLQELNGVMEYGTPPS